MTEKRSSGRMTPMRDVAGGQLTLLATRRSGKRNTTGRWRSRSGSKQPLRVAEPRWRCRVCHDIGFVRADMPLGHSDFGRALPCACRIEVMKRREYGRALQASCLGELREQTFASFRGRVQQEALRAAQAFAREPGGLLLLMGVSGTGKSHLVAGIGHAVL